MEFLNSKAQELPKTCFIKSSAQVFMTQYLFLQNDPDKWEQKHRAPDTYHKNIDYANVMKFMKINIEFDTEQVENTKSAWRQKTSFPKESVENEDLYIPVLNKVMTTIMREIPFCSSFNKTHFIFAFFN